MELGGGDENFLELIQGNVQRRCFAIFKWGNGWQTVREWLVRKRMACAGEGSDRMKSIGSTPNARCTSARS